MDGLPKLVSEALGHVKYLVKTLKAPQKHVFGAVAVRFEFHALGLLKLATPWIAKREGNRKHSHEIFNTVTLGHVRVFKLIATLFQVTEQGLDAPSHSIEIQRLLA